MPVETRLLRLTPGELEVYLARIAPTTPVVRWNGVPVVFARVVFREGETDKRIDGSSVTRTDEEGRFSMKILKGLEGELSGSVFIDPRQFTPCPHLRTLISDREDAESNIVKIKSDKTLDAVALKLTLPSCNKTKIIGRIRVD